METIKTQCGKTVEVSLDIIQPGDDFVLNNPHPDSSLKNVIRKCSINDGSIIPVDNGLALRKYPITWCKKIIKYLLK